MRKAQERLEATQGTPALERGLAVVQAVANRHRDGVTPRELREVLGLPQASLYRLLKSLADAGWLLQDPLDGRFRLGRAVMTLGFRARTSSSLVQAATPILREIAKATHQMSELAVRIGTSSLMMLETWTAEETPLRVQSRPGLFYPLNHGTAHGLCFLAFDAPERLGTYLQQLRREKGEAEAALLEQQISRWRKLGFTWIHQTPNRIARVAVPVFEPAPKSPRLAGSLAIACGIEVFNPARAAAWGLKLRAKARELEKSLQL